MTEVAVTEAPQRYRRGVAAVDKSSPAYRGQANYSRVFLSAYDAIHCLPGTIPSKRPAFERARKALAPGGTFFGATILSPDEGHNPLGRAVVNLNNRLGVMSNQHDTREALDAELHRHFNSHKLEVAGTVALFSAQAG